MRSVTLTQSKPIGAATVTMFSSIYTPVEPQSSGSYSMESRLRGKVLIFNQREFSNGYSTRIGTDRDVERLLKVLPRLGYAREHIEVFENLKASGIEKVALKLQQDAQLHLCDSLVVFFLTHGEKNDKLVAKDETFHLYEFMEKFKPAVMPAMAGKPKLFFVQACRGHKLKRGKQLQNWVSETASYVADGVASVFLSAPYAAAVYAAESFDEEESPPDSFPEFSDFLIAMSAQHGHLSFRNEQGSWFIQELCNAFETFNPHYDSILDILTTTNCAVSKRTRNVDGRPDNRKQIANFYSTLTKKLYFKPFQY
ncbi:caspase-1-like [Culex pipiens pallens]|uniref:caspase-1-like n=1 Tax=Culex pipiens pallens TaxID=42434 RepID=UPI001953A7CA|nr:caspase-1-like [Culex pipiens pallens]